MKAARVGACGISICNTMMVMMASKPSLNASSLPLPMTWAFLRTWGGRAPVAGQTGQCCRTGAHIAASMSCRCSLPAAVCGLTIARVFT